MTVVRAELINEITSGNASKGQKQLNQLISFVSNFYD